MSVENINYAAIPSSDDIVLDAGHSSEIPGENTEESVRLHGENICLAETESPSSSNSTRLEPIIPPPASTSRRSLGRLNYPDKY